MLQIPFLMFSRVGESASTIYKNDFCSLERADHTFCVFTNGRGRFYYSQNVFYVLVRAPVPSHVFSRLGEGASTIRKMYFN